MQKNLKRKIIAIFFLVNFLTTLVPYNAIYGNNNGPKAPEAGSFEPVDATDMVSLLTGDVNYVLPLLEVPSPEGNYPLVLAYHGGIAYDQESTWVGLGWNLNPGVINRNVNGYPDDWSGGVVRNRTYYNYTSQTVTVGIGLGNDKVNVEAGIGYSWDSNGSQSGSVSLSITEKNSGLGGNVSVGFGSNGWSVSAGASYTHTNKETKVESAYGISADSNGSINGSARFENEDNNSLGVSFGTSGLSLNYQLAGIGGSINNSSNNSSSADVSTLSAGLKIPIAPLIYLKFGYRKIKYQSDVTHLNKVWGPLYFNELNESPEIAPDRYTYGNVLGNEHSRDSYMDTYDQPLPEEEQEIIDFDDTFEKYKNSFSNPAYDNYVVNAQGLSGTMKPRLLENGYLIGRGSRHEYNVRDGNPRNISNVELASYVAQEIIADRGSKAFRQWLAFKALEKPNLSQANLLSLLLPNAPKVKIKESAVLNYNFDLDKGFDKSFGNAPNNLHFYFDHQLHSNLTINENSINTRVPSNANNINQFFTGIHQNHTVRNENTNFIETFTNEEINSLKQNNSYFLESKDLDRNLNPSKGIGAYRITTADGKTYHYSHPVYQYEEFNRKLMTNDQGNQNPDDDTYYPEADQYREHRKVVPYATHWLLTAVTGPDYVKMSDSSIKHPSNEDYGYWIRFDYGSWTEGYAWRTPKRQGDYNNLTYDVNKSAYEYSWGRKELVYLNKAVTRSHTALFVKSLRTDDEGSEIGGRNRHDFPSFEGDDFVHYIPQKALKLDRIILIKSEDDNIEYNNEFGNLITDPNGRRTVLWKTMSNISYNTNCQKNILDRYDFNDSIIYGKALKVIDFGQDYSLAKEDLSNDNSGRLTLNSVNFKGKRGFNFMPPYTFSYIGKEKEYNYCANFVNCEKDSWGYHKDEVDLWSMNKIKTPTGAEIRIEYEEDDYYTEAFARRFWSEGLTFDIDNFDSNHYLIKVANDPDFVDQVDFRDYFEGGKKTFMDLWIAYRHNRRKNFGFSVDASGAVFDIDSKRVNDPNLCPLIFSVTENYVQFKVKKDLGYGNINKRMNNNLHFNENAILNKDAFGRRNNLGTGRYEERDRNDTPSYVRPPTAINSTIENHCMYYNILSNITPKADTGGGVRAKSIGTYSDTGEFTKLEYSYNDPTDPDKSSGITSYAPVRGYKYVAYQSELPAPKVNYEYVTLSDVGATGESQGHSVYHFDVLKPAIDIFSKNLNIGNHFKSEVIESELARNTNGVNVKLYDNTAMIGSLLSLSEYNSYGHLLRKKENHYKSFEELTNTDRGSLQESFLSMKSVYDFRAKYAELPFEFNLSIPDVVSFNINFSEEHYFGTQSSLNLKKRFANVSTKITYPLIEEYSEVTEGGYITRTEFLDPDSKTGEYLTTITTRSDGLKIKNTKYPAYKVYSEMGSKVDRETNKNMLSQEAGNFTYLYKDNDWVAVGANITTWNNQWVYYNNTGNIESSSHIIGPRIWRKHQNYIWSGNLNEDGTYNNFKTENENYGFVWGVGLQQGADTKWQQISEITRYNHFSKVLETRDINHNYASTKMDKKQEKIISVSNSGYSEQFYSGVEAGSNNWVGGEVSISNYSSTYSHTGNYSEKSRQGLKSFNCFVTPILHNGELNKKFKISVWAHKNNYQNTRIYDGQNIVEFNGEIQIAGDWVLLTHYTELSVRTEVYLTSNSGDLYLDDFRLHPIASTMNNYVYNEFNELTFIIGANGLSTCYFYDEAGRLKEEWIEVLDKVENPINDNEKGGFKRISKNNYSYKTEFKRF